jgi:hypothetical protein
MSIIEPGYAYFPIAWSDGGDDGANGEPVFDPSIIFVEPADDGDHEDMLAVSLADVVEGFIDGARSRASGDKIEASDPKDVDIAIAVRDELRRLADLIDKALP